jgi:hypothetical protein
LRNRVSPAAFAAKSTTVAAFLGAVAAAAALALLAAPAGCKRPGGGPAKPGAAAARLPLRPAAEGRPQLLATVVAGNPDRLFASAVEMMKAAGVPMDARTIRASALSALKLPAAVAATLRTDGPVTAVVVQAAPDPEPPSVVVAAPVDAGRSAGLAQALGKETARNLDAVEVEIAGEPPRKLWLLVRDGAALMAEKQPALIAGGALALEAWAAARTATTGDVDVAVNVFPEALAQAQNIDLSMYVYKLKENFKASWKVTAKHGESGAHFANAGVMDAVLDVLAGRAVDVASAGVDLRVDAKRGLGLLWRVQPKADTAFARAAAARAAYTLDPVVMGGDGAKGSSASSRPVLVGAGGPLPLNGELRRAITAVVAAAAGSAAVTTSAKGPAKGRAGPNLGAGAAWAAMVAELSGKLTGAWTVRGDATSRGLGYAYVCALAPGAEPDEVIELLGRVLQDKAAAGALVVAVGGGMLAPALKVTRKRARLHVQATLQKKKIPPASAAAMRLVAPGDRVDISIGAAAGRLLVVAGPDAAARLERMAGAAAGGAGGAPPAAPPAPAGALAEALVESAGQDAMLFVDLGVLMKAVASSASTGVSAGRAGPAPGDSAPGEPLPLFFVLRGGPSVSLDVRVPLVTVARAATFARTVAATGFIPTPGE